MTKVQVIINPASGIAHPVLKTLDSVLGDEVEWDVSITHKSGDARRFSQAAVAAGADIVATYGGDGTVSEVASVLAGGEVPLAILPGGTGNGVARMLAIPMDLEASAALLRQDYVVRPVDLGRVNDHTFMLRADLGFLAVTGAETARITKEHLGKWAYALSSIQHLDLLSPIPYQLTLDGEEVEMEGVLCMVFNMGAVAFGHRPLAKGISPDDGLLDLLVLRRHDIVALGEVGGSAILGNPTPMQHWQIKRATINPVPPQPMSVDGELIENSPAEVRVLPKAVRVIVPPTWAAR